MSLGENVTNTDPAYDKINGIGMANLIPRGWICMLQNQNQGMQILNYQPLS